MSFAISKAVLERHFGSSLLKLVMLVLADHAHKDGTGIWPSAATISAKTEFCLRSVRKATRQLEERGLLVYKRQKRCRAGYVNVWSIDLDALRRLPRVISGAQYRSRADMQGVQSECAASAAPVVQSAQQAGAPDAHKPIQEPIKANRSLENSAARPSRAHVRKLKRLCDGFEDVLWDERSTREWTAQVSELEAEGADFELDILPGVRSFFQTHRGRQQRDAIWAPIRTLRHPGIVERIERRRKDRYGEEGA